MTKLELPDVTKDKGVKAHVRTMLEICGTEHEPATAATPRMLSNMLVGGGVIDRRYGTLTFVGAREKVQIVFEGVGGCRIGEVVGSGDSHGLLANETAILTNLDGGGKGPEVEVVVEAKLSSTRRLATRGTSTWPGPRRRASSARSICESTGGWRAS
jgi:hypothetical protein